MLFLNQLQTKTHFSSKTTTYGVKITSFKRAGKCSERQRKNPRGGSRLSSSVQGIAFIEPIQRDKIKGIPCEHLDFSAYHVSITGRFCVGNAEDLALFLGDENTIYRLMNNPLINWRKLLLSFAKQFAVKVKTNGVATSAKSCFIVDDTDLEKTGKTMEFISRIHNHIMQKFPLGFKMLTLGFWEGKSLIAVDFSLHREKRKDGTFGLNKKERSNQFHKKREQSLPSAMRVKELDEKKTEVAISMIKRAVKNGLVASYVLMDSWFTNDYMFKSVRSIKNGAMHLLGMCKIDNRKYTYDCREMNAHQLITRYERKKGKHSSKHKSHYIELVVDYKEEKVKLFFVKYRNCKTWRCILSTNLTLKFTAAIELYQIRWTIEVLFKECKQYLRLGTCQNTDFDGQIADTTIVLITHTILTLQRRFEAYETMGGLFRESQQQLLELTLWERILKVFIKMLRELLEILSIDIEETIEKIMTCDKSATQLLAMLEAIHQSSDKPAYFPKTAA